MSKWIRPADPEKIKEKVKLVPENPGVYKYVSAKGVILYIGKAKNLKKRVSSYWVGGKNHPTRILRMLAQVDDILYTVTHTESEALLLESNLIKEHQPRYNIMLKDGKSYPFICIKNEPFPRVFYTRKKIKDGSQYFGPYPSGITMHAIMDLIKFNFKIRTCNLPLQKKSIQANKFRICLEYQIGKCTGPCEALITEEEYMDGIESIKKILKGSFSSLQHQLHQRMMQFAENYQFEKAEIIRQRIEHIQNYQEKNAIISKEVGNLEVITIDRLNDLSIINHFKVVEGAIVQTHSWEFRIRNEEEDSEILAAVFSRLAEEEGENMAKEILTNISFPLEEPLSGYKLKIPTSGDKKKMLDLSLKNCRVLLEEKVWKQNFQKKNPEEEVLLQLQKDLRLPNLPRKIECFDNSNLQGNQPVASMVVFQNAKPLKREYRHFKIKTVVGPDDFASMKEIVFRRYSRLKSEGGNYPDLIVIDGGKGQLSHAAESLEELGLLRSIPIIGIAKKLEEIYVLNDPFPLHLDKRSTSLKLIQQLRNEAHRFAITFHRQLRSNALIKTTLQEIPGIGKTSANQLLSSFKSIKKIKEATLEELEKIVGKKRARIVEIAIKNGELED